LHTLPTRRSSDLPHLAIGLHAFAFPGIVVGADGMQLRIAGRLGLLHGLLEGDPVGARLVGQRDSAGATKNGDGESCGQFLVVHGRFPSSDLRSGRVAALVNTSPSAPQGSSPAPPVAGCGVFQRLSNSEPDAHSASFKPGCVLLAVSKPTTGNSS